MFFAAMNANQNSAKPGLATIAGQTADTAFGRKLPARIAGIRRGELQEVIVGHPVRHALRPAFDGG